MRPGQCSEIIYEEYPPERWRRNYVS
jgi:hypothetical protein